jgi:hypothetical protein
LIHKIKLNARGKIIEVPKDILDKSSVFQTLNNYNKTKDKFNLNFDEHTVHKFIDYLSGYSLEEQYIKNIKNICDFFSVPINTNLESTEKLKIDFLIENEIMHRTNLKINYVYEYKNITFKICHDCKPVILRNLLDCDCLDDDDNINNNNTKTKKSRNININTTIYTIVGNYPLEKMNNTDYKLYVNPSCKCQLYSGNFYYVEHTNACLKDTTTCINKFFIDNIVKKIIN